MSITDKTRKILWGRSGNRCAICKHELVLESTDIDDESIVGDECHIESGQKNGPRYNQGLPTEELDNYNNLILLCRIHHKMIDDQHETYTREIVLKMKGTHEKWVTEKLTDNDEPKPLKLRRKKENLPEYLIRLTTGKELLNLVEGACASSLDHDELETQAEVDLIGNFLEIVQDWGDIGSELGPGKRVEVTFNLTQTIKELEDAGFYVFGTREIQEMSGGFGGPKDWPVITIRLLRKNNPEIITVPIENTQE